MGKKIVVLCLDVIMIAVFIFYSRKTLRKIVPKSARSY